ncbi:MAG: TonB-dependent receptor [Bacteroides sp.]|nr:TonB-dependent receptor [Bacteroides sp.]
MKKLIPAIGVWVCRLVVVALFPSLASAQEQNDSISGKVHQLDAVTVRARRMPAKITSATSVQVLSKEDLKNLGLQNMGDAVKRFAGTNVRDYGGIGGLKTVSVRNLGAAHTAVSYDGVAISNTQAGQIDIGRFSLDNVSNLSLAIGHDDNMLQSARLFASAGVLNIETEKPHFEDGRRSLTQLQVRGGSFGYLTPAIRHWQQLGERTRLAVNANYLRADGEYPFTLKNGNQKTEEKRINSDVESWQGEVNLFHTFKDESELNAKAYYYQSERGLPGAVILYNNASDERLWDKNFFAQARYKKVFSPKWTFQAQGKFNHSWNKYEDLGVEYTGGKQTDINRQQEYYVSASALYRPIQGLSFSLSQDGAINKLHTNGVNSPEPTRYTSLTALNARYQVQRLKVSGTVVATYITEEVKAGNTPEDRKRLSPTLSMSWQPWESEQLFVRALYKNTFRVPTFSDLYYLRVGNTNLRPEKATEYTVGITWSGKPFSFTDFLSITVDGYYNEVNDKIIAFPSTYVWKMQNYGEVQITGIDVTLATAIPVHQKVNLNFSGNYSWQKAIDVTNPDAKNYKHQLPYTPEHNGNISATLEMPWVSIGYTVTMMGKRYYLAQNIEANEIDGYNEHTTTIWREFGIGKSKLRLQVEIINLTDAQYDVIKYYPMPGRSWRLTGTFNF